MLPDKYLEAFYRVTNFYNCWIGLREPNPLALKYIGKPGYVPKPVTCKAKTASKKNHEFEGLVVNPTICKLAFDNPNSLDIALEKWKKFTENGRLPKGFTSEKTGLVLYEGYAIYSDFDLMNIVPADGKGQMEKSNKNAAPRFPKNQVNPHYSTNLHLLQINAIQMLNLCFGIPLIQHGPEFSYIEGVGAIPIENVYYFGPNRQLIKTISSMATHFDKRH